jgi:hypothetical protein
MELQGENKHPPQTRRISGIQTRKFVGENLEPKPKTANPKSVDICPEPDPLSSSDKEDSEGNVDDIKQYIDARWVTP